MGRLQIGASQADFRDRTRASTSAKVNTQPVEFLEYVEGDLRRAMTFMTRGLTNGGDVFFEKFRETIRWIEWNPEMFPRKYSHFRRAIIRRSYFGVFFAIEPEVTVVVAVLDLRRDPRAVRELLQGGARQK